MKLFGKVLGFLLLLSISLFCHAEPSSQKAKRIYITLDVSGSMRGNKYVMANYAAQVISVFSNTNDLVYLYYLGSKHDLGSSNGYKAIQIPYQNLPSRKNTYSEISDLTGFVNSYHPDPNYQDWLFIVGDGDWDYRSAKGEYDTTIEKLKNLLRKEHLQVCYLQTGETVGQEYAFTRFLLQQNSPFVDVRKSDISASSVLENCIYFTNKILGFSNMSVGLQPAGDSCVSFSSEFPLERCLLVCQSDKVTTKDLKILSVECSGSVVNVSTKGNPSTRPLVDEDPVLSGAVWELNSLQTIPANETVKVRFNQKIDSHSLIIYPYVDVTIAMHPWSVNMDTLVEPKPDCFQICDKENRVLVKINITDRYGRKFLPPLMQKMNVKFVISGTEIPASYSSSDTTFSAVLPVPGDTVSYLSVVESPGYFNRTSELQTVTKSPNACPPEKLPMITLPAQHFESIRFKDLIENNEFGGKVEDSLFQAIASFALFDEKKTEDLTGYNFVGAVSFDQNDNRLVFSQLPKSNWCECAFPDTMRYNVTLGFSDGLVIGDNSYSGFIIPVLVPVDKRPWLMRCKYYLITGISIFVFILYLWALLNKKRFKKDAKVVPSYVKTTMGRRSEQSQRGTPLRKKSFGAWLNRWFNPFGNESNAIKLSSLGIPSIRFVAGQSKEEVKIVSSSFNSKTMSMAGSRNNVAVEEGKLIPFYGKITFYSDSTKKREIGTLVFSSGSNDDEGGYRIFLILELLISLAAELFVIFVLFKSI